MGAGARLAEERDRWPGQWLVADLEQEEEQLLDLLAPAEELRAAVPGLRTGGDGGGQVLIGITDQRALIVGRWQAAEATSSGEIVRVSDVTRCVALVERRGPIPFGGGHLVLDLDDDALTRLWDHVDGLPGVGKIG